MKEIQLTEELERFHIHLKDNPRTILTAVFGNGKTTFLKQYVKRYEEEGEFITLHPVNYSCSPNEDVFEYIKRDILLQLATKNLFADVDLDAIDASLFSWDNIKDIMELLLSLHPAGAAAAKLWEKFQPWIDKGIKAKEAYEKKKVTWEKYKNFFDSQKGGVYEHDAYTVLIEKTLESIHTRTTEKKHSTLIIEDMDRIDPAHLFRILNVLGAHMDTGDGEGNKFGFKNIVLVLDYEATEHIFHHFYGEKANYNGYMNKFICHNVFQFNIVEAARRELINQLCSKCSFKEEVLESIPVQGTGYNQVITLIRIIYELSVRDIAHILDDLESQISNNPLEVNGYIIKNVAPITILLAVLVRLNRPVNYYGLFDYLSDKPLILYLLQQYLLHDSYFVAGRSFLLKRNGWAVSPQKCSDGVYVVNICQSLGAFSSTDDVVGHLKSCFNFAMENVKDCRYK